MWNPLRPAIWQLSAWLQNWVEHRFRISRRKLPSARCLSTSAIPASGNFQPMNVNFGIMTPLGYKVKGKANKNLAIAERSLAIIDQMVREHNV